MSSPHIDVVARELSLTPQQVGGALALFDAGNTLPFIARYRKEATGGLDEVQLRDVRDRAQYLAEMDDRRRAILKSIEEQGKLTDSLRAKIAEADTKQLLEDLYLPYKPKRRTRAMIARERGLEPLAELIEGDRHDDVQLEEAAKAFVDLGKDVPDTIHALAGARDVLVERLAEDAELRGVVRETTRAKGTVRSRVLTGKENDVSKFQDYYDFSQAIVDIPSHRMLAIRRGEAESMLLWSIGAPSEEIVGALEQRYVTGRRAETQWRLVVHDAYKRLIAPGVEVDLRLELKARADEEAIKIFGQNLEQLLLASPAGERIVLGLDPGFRTGVKAAIVSRTGAVLATDTCYLHQPDRFAHALLAYVARFGVELIAIGNGTASRETETLVRTTLREWKSHNGESPNGDSPNGDAHEPQVVVVNEAGASVYSASDLAREELPDLDVSLRGAVAIARRLQDPLAELVKIDPKSIGVGQYQHDVNQVRLKQRLDETVESCVNRVGVEVNTASIPLLSYVAGIGPTLAANIVKSRDERGGFTSRNDLSGVPRLGAKAFEQAAGFLRIRGGVHPLDASAVHPERYSLVEHMASDLGVDLTALIGNTTVINTIDIRRYVSDDVGVPTLNDILGELRKPARDPRSAFEPPPYRDDVRELKDLSEGMVLDGVVTNIVAFGAFVDIGVHQDGLVHVSQLSDRYVADPNMVVRVGQKVKVRVISVDLARNRIALSMNSGAPRARGDVKGGREATRGNARGSAQSGSAQSGRRVPPPKAEPARPLKSGDYAPNGMRFR